MVKILIGTIYASKLSTILTNKNYFRFRSFGHRIAFYHARGKENKTLRGGMRPL